MSFSRAGDLSTRLKSLHDMYTGEESVWDIGCDHGLLGLSFRETDSVKNIHLVDPSLLVIQELERKLKDSYITKPVYIHHKPGQEIQLTSNSNCIFIAGMGGMEILSIIDALIPQLNESSTLVISPHRKILELRKALSEMPIALNQEALVYEDGQFYQILKLSPGWRGEKVTLYGAEIWKGEVGQSYLEHQLKHFIHHRDEASRAYVAYLQSLK